MTASTSRIWMKKAATWKTTNAPTQTKNINNARAKNIKRMRNPSAAVADKPQYQRHLERITQATKVLQNAGKRRRPC
jgi:hypothetical protein